MLWLPALLLLAAAGGAPEVQSFTLYKIQQRIGVERSYVTRDRAGTEIRKQTEFIIEESRGESSVGFNRNDQGAITSLSLLDQNGIILSRE